MDAHAKVTNATLQFVCRLQACGGMCWYDTLVPEYECKKTERERERKVHCRWRKCCSSSDRSGYSSNSQLHSRNITALAATHRVKMKQDDGSRSLSSGSVPQMVVIMTYELVGSAYFCAMMNPPTTTSRPFQRKEKHKQRICQVQSCRSACRSVG